MSWINLKRMIENENHNQRSIDILPRLKSWEDVKKRWRKKMKTRITIELDIPGEFTTMENLAMAINQKYLGAALAYWRDVEEQINAAGGLSAKERKTMMNNMHAWEKVAQKVVLCEVSCEKGKLKLDD
jgi:hypothetical protein